MQMDWKINFVNNCLIGMNILLFCGCFQLKKVDSLSPQEEQILRSVGVCSRLSLGLVEWDENEVDEFEIPSVKGHFLFYTICKKKFYEKRATPKEIQQLFEYELFLGRFDRASIYYQAGATADIPVGPHADSIFATYPNYLPETPDEFREKQHSMLDRSIRFGMRPLRDALLKFGANPSYAPGETTPLWCAVITDDEESYRLLRKNGADKECLDYLALMATASQQIRNRYVFLEDFLKRGYNPNKCNILLAWTTIEDEKAIKLLLQYGADPNLKLMPNEMSAHEYAEKFNLQSILDLFEASCISVGRF